MLRVVLSLATALSVTTSAVPIPPNYQHLTSAEVATNDCWLEEAPPSTESSFFGDARPFLKCNWTNRIQSAYDTNADLYMDWNVTVSCPSSRSKTVEDFPTAKSMRKQAFELWNEDECTCQVNEVIKYRQNQAGQTEEVPIEACSCTMCPYGYGKSHVMLDCSTSGSSSPTGIDVQTAQNPEPILDDCTSFDCNHACNGDCGLTCDAAGPECCLCRDDCPEPTPSPTTAAPTTAAPTSTPTDDTNLDKSGGAQGSTATPGFGKLIPWVVSGLSLLVGFVVL